VYKYVNLFNSSAGNLSRLSSGNILRVSFSCCLGWLPCLGAQGNGVPAALIISK